MAELRFFIDHGLIHDRATGRHVTTGEDSAFEDGIEACCKLLNKISTSADELHAVALECAGLLMGAEPGTLECTVLDKLASGIEGYESIRIPAFSELETEVMERHARHIANQDPNADPF